jgi:hypothetical protein
MLPSIAIPRVDAYYTRDGRYGDREPCLVCGKAVNHATAKWVKLDEGLSLIVDPETPEPNGGHFPVGPECWRKNSVLRKYLAS